MLQRKGYTDRGTAGHCVEDAQPRDTESARSTLFSGTQTIFDSVLQVTRLLHYNMVSCIVPQGQHHSV
jgi:hypothetical protein